MRFSPPALVVFVLLVGASPAFAHNLMTDSRMVGGRLRVEVFYDDNTPAQDAKVSVKNGDATVAEGRTDEKGVWVWEKPSPGTYTVHGQSVGHASRPETVEIKNADIPPRDASADPGPPPESVTRAAKTRTPWRNLALGLGLIAGAILLSQIFRRRTGAPAGVGSKGKVD
ncbi:MAG: carboxypeptidase regulatory-like domain-containing protein [Zavarzinella sp.]|nr:carboxypeptidase regulatory-like domain-containing protein [Zavarzinella sp.]